MKYENDILNRTHSFVWCSIICNADEKEPVIYRNSGDVAAGPIKIKNELSLIGRNISNNNSND
jgi:hypothetical protein